MHISYKRFRVEGLGLNELYKRMHGFQKLARTGIIAKYRQKMQTESMGHRTPNRKQQGSRDPRIAETE